MGHRRRGPLEQEGLVRRAPLLRMAREPRLQNAYPGAAVQVPQLHAVSELSRCASEARCAALAPRHVADRCARAIIDRALPHLLRAIATARAAGCGHGSAAR